VLAAAPSSIAAICVRRAYTRIFSLAAPPERPLHSASLPLCFPKTPCASSADPPCPFLPVFRLPLYPSPPLFPLCRGRPLTRVAGMSKQRITNWIDDSLPPLCVPASQPMTTAKHTMTQLLVAATIASREGFFSLSFPSLPLSLSLCASFRGNFRFRLAAGLPLASIGSKQRDLSRRGQLTVARARDPMRMSPLLISPCKDIDYCRGEMR